MSELIKVLLLGLDNSGKTTILTSLKENTTIYSFLEVQPTRGLKMEKIDNPDYNLNIWDFGGQEQYRAEYLNKFDTYLPGVNRIIYVIDIQDIERFNLALNYMEEVIKLLQEYDRSVDFSIFLHKFDPDLEQYNKKVNENTVNEIIDLMKERIPTNFNYSIHKTSIYTIFEKSRLF